MQFSFGSSESSSNKFSDKNDLAPKSDTGPRLKTYDGLPWTSLNKHWAFDLADCQPLRAYFTFPTEQGGSLPEPRQVALLSKLLNKLGLEIPYVLAEQFSFKLIESLVTESPLKSDDFSFLKGCLEKNISIDWQAQVYRDNPYEEQQIVHSTTLGFIFAPSSEVPTNLDTSSIQVSQLSFKLEYHAISSTLRAALEASSAIQQVANQKTVQDSSITDLNWAVFSDCIQEFLNGREFALDQCSFKAIPSRQIQRLSLAGIDLDVSWLKAQQFWRLREEAPTSLLNTDLPNLDRVVLGADPESEIEVPKLKIQLEGCPQHLIRQICEEVKLPDLAAIITQSQNVIESNNCELTNRLTSAISNFPEADLAITAICDIQSENQSSNLEVVAEPSVDITLKHTEVGNVKLHIRNRFLEIDISPPSLSDIYQDLIAPSIDRESLMKQAFMLSSVDRGKIREITGEFLLG